MDVLEAPIQFGLPLVITGGVTLMAVFAAVLLHYEGLSFIGRLLKRRTFHHRTKILVLILAQLGLHFMEIWVFALGIIVLVSDSAFGAVSPMAPGDVLDIAYFSAITFTTVGYGDFVPMGPIRFLCGMEALTGFVLITWSASFTFIEMQRYWGRD